jgi:hypothetical protein
MWRGGARRRRGPAGENARAVVARRGDVLRVHGGRGLTDIRVRVMLRVRSESCSESDPSHAPSQIRVMLRVRSESCSESDPSHAPTRSARARTRHGHRIADTCATVTEACRARGPAESESDPSHAVSRVRADADYLMMNSMQLLCCKAIVLLLSPDPRAESGQASPRSGCNRAGGAWQEQRCLARPLPGPYHAWQAWQEQRRRGMPCRRGMAGATGMVGAKAGGHVTW